MTAIKAIWERNKQKRRGKTLPEHPQEWPENPNDFRVLRIVENSEPQLEEQKNPTQKKGNILALWSLYNESITTKNFLFPRTLKITLKENL